MCRTTTAWQVGSSVPLTGEVRFLPYWAVQGWYKVVLVAPVPCSQISADLELPAGASATARHAPAILHDAHPACLHALRALRSRFWAVPC